MTDEKKVDAEAVGKTVAAVGTTMMASGCLLMLLPFFIVAVVIFGVVLWTLLFG